MVHIQLECNNFYCNFRSNFYCNFRQNFIFLSLISLKILDVLKSVCRFLILKFFTELPVRFVKTLEEEVTVIKGQPLYLSCELNKERDVVWRKDGKIVVEKPGKIVPGVIGLMRALTINDTDDFDAGTYTVTVENANNLECSSCVKVVG